MDCVPVEYPSKSVEPVVVLLVFEQGPTDGCPPYLHGPLQDFSTLRSLPRFPYIKARPDIKLFEEKFEGDASLQQCNYDNDGHMVDSQRLLHYHTGKLEISV